ncbi:TIGR03089 family protein [Dermacoccaceae bacterium W4C1]
MTVYQDTLGVALSTDATAPRVTFYEDTPGPSAGERIELSAKVIDNWVSKAANLLQDELDGSPGVRVALDLPAEHWRTVYWALAAWAVGATVTDTWAEGDILITDRPRPEVDLQVVVTLAALARAGADVPADAVDEAAELSGYGDQFMAYEEPEIDEPALETASGSWAFADLTPAPDAGRVLLAGDLAAVTRGVLAALAGDGSVLICRGATGDLSQRLAQEGVTG